MAARLAAELLTHHSTPRTAEASAAAAADAAARTSAAAYLASAAEPADVTLPGRRK
jgi:hypothetical protein